MATQGDGSAAKHLQLKKAVGPNMAYLCTAMEIGVLKAFIDWKVFDHIPDHSQISSAGLAEKVGGQQELLDRTLPLLVATEILTAPEPGCVAHTDRSRLYKSGQLGAGFLTHMHNLFIGSIAHFPAFLAAHGFSSPKDALVTPFGLAAGHPNQNVYDIIAADAKLSKDFDSFVGRASKVFPMRGVYDLSWMLERTDTTSKFGRPLFVDIGGSNGHALWDILQDHPWLPAERCVVFDRAPTIKETRANLDEGIKSIQLVAGSVLDTFPPSIQGAMMFQLRRILNDFPDDDVRKCWKSIREAAASDTRVNVVEELLQANRSAYAVAQDLSLMLIGGKRRNAQMHADLAAEAGFELSRTFPDTYNDCSVLEFVLA
ncbi:S-adenosyl-L-methionine-dependent methyltransferase [Decorospora gaudefroyi]|uniref:S-adenosyl-L-methionine-dependent methyltransferase n=1 Tax=Decorospora gaudefroyi TaxID=184978 RepID=A0A6A5JX77_9PLEO|nr:S-adenosyl-L-methionine-dependent methyltransferase [Decorospora gaudefroyi]